MCEHDGSIVFLAERKELLKKITVTLLQYITENITIFTHYSQYPTLISTLKEVEYDVSKSDVQKTKKKKQWYNNGTTMVGYLLKVKYYNMTMEMESFSLYMLLRKG